MRTKGLMKEGRNAGLSVGRIENSFRAFNARPLIRASVITAIVLSALTASAAFFLHRYQTERVGAVIAAPAVEAAPVMAERVSADVDDAEPQGEDASLALTALNQDDAEGTAEAIPSVGDAAMVLSPVAAAANAPEAIATPIENAAETLPAAEAGVQPSVAACVLELAREIEPLRIQFRINSAQIVTPDLPVAIRVAESATRCPGARVKIIGHTDTTGDEFRNFQLSWARADAVLAAMKQAGYDSGQFVTLGVGARQPIETIDWQTEADHPELRRVEFDVDAMPVEPAIGSDAEITVGGE